jgi:cold shock CspA family protein
MLAVPRSSFFLLLVFAEAAVAQSTSRVSIDSLGNEGGSASELCSISSDGRFIAFQSAASNLVANDTNGQRDIFVHDRLTGTTERVSIDSFGAESNGDCVDPSISADGRFVVFQASASNFVAGDTNGASDVFVHDRVTGITERVSVDSFGAQAVSGCYTSAFGPAISGNGQFVVFSSEADNLVAGDSNVESDIFVYDRVTGVTERVSIDSAGVEANAKSYFGAISGDGAVVTFQSFASNLVAGDSNNLYDVFVHDRSTGMTARVSVDSAGSQANGDGYTPTISADGNVVAFTSWATNLVASDSNGCGDVFLHDRATGTTERVSVDSSGNEGNLTSDSASISADGRVVVFESRATNLDGSDPYGFEDIFVHDRSSGTTYRASVDSTGALGNSDSFNPPSISADGSAVAFESNAANLVAYDTNGASDIFVHTRCMVDATWTNYGQGFPGTNGIPAFTSEGDPVLGGSVTLDLGNSYGKISVGLTVLGFQQASIHSSLGGDLLVQPFSTFLVGLAPSGSTITGTLPDNDLFCGDEVDLQALEIDPGAAKGVSFTQGLELILGH